MHEHQKFWNSLLIPQEISTNCVSCLLCLNIEINLLFANAVEFLASALELRNKNISH